MRLHAIPCFFIMIVFCCCNDKSKKSIEYPVKGSILLFDTASGKNIVSSEDKKLISTWDSFREAMSKSDYKKMRSLSHDSIICFCGDVDEDNIIKPVDTFYKKYSSKLFSRSFISLTFDNLKVWSRYDRDSMYYNSFLTTTSNLERPKIVEVNLSFPVPPGEHEGTLGTLAFIETKNTYKFFGYFTIP